MSAIRLPLLCAFAGGCLSNALLFGLWRVGEGASDSAARQQHRSDNVVELVTAASATPSVAQPSEPVAASAADRGHDPASEAAVAVTPVASDLDSAGPTPAGSAVSDVLTRLETAYRERVAARAPAPASAIQERAPAAAPPDTALAPTEAPPSVPPQPVAEVVPAVSPVAATAPAAFAPQVAPAALAPQQPAAMPALAAQDAPPPPPPSEIHYGDVNYGDQNTYITNVRQGDVYLIQMQQVAMLQYLQLLGMSSGLAAPGRHVGGAGRQRGTLSSGITNPDNPWGFHFAPPNLVR